MAHQKGVIYSLETRYLRVLVFLHKAVKAVHQVAIETVEIVKLAEESDEIIIIIAYFYALYFF